MLFEGKLFRALDVVWQHLPLSGEGARIAGGRFNPRGTKCLYTSLRYEIALRETVQGIGDFQPTTVVSYRAYFDDILDLDSPEKMRAHGVDPAMLLARSWRDEMDRHGKSASQDFAEATIGQGYAGILVPSVAPGAEPGDVNMVLWDWGPDRPHQLLLVDDTDRLGRAQRRIG